MNPDDIKAASGEALDAAGATMHLIRITKEGGHAFDESDDSYRRRLLAQLIGAAAADAVSQPPEVTDSPKPKKKLRDDGPTVQEYVEAGLDARTYPPRGFAAKSSDEEIAAAIKAQDEAKDHVRQAEQEAAADTAADGDNSKTLP